MYVRVLLVLAGLFVTASQSFSAATPSDNPFRQSIIFFEVNGQKVIGTFTRPAGKAKYPVVLFLHGMGGNRHGPNGLFSRTAHRLAMFNIASLRISTRGRGGSDGDFKNMTFSRRVDESAAAVRWLAKQGSIDPAHITILGHSQGSYVATATAAMIPIILKIHSVVLWAPTVNPRLAYQHSLGRKLYERAMQAHKDEIIRWRGVSGRGRAFRAGFFHGLKNVNHGAELQKYTGRVLIVTGRHDRWSPTWAATEFSKQHGGETTIWEINTGHRMGAYGSRRDLNNFIDRTKKWLLK